MKTNSAAGTRHQFNLEHVIAITADINYSYVHIHKEESLLLSRTLKWFADQWPTLVRIHKNALINLNYVDHYSISSGKSPSGYIVMKNGLQLEISRRNVRQVGQQLMQLKIKNNSNLVPTN